MGLRMKGFLTKLKQENKGSFTLEASLVFPILFIVTIALILFSLYIYDKVVLFQRANVIAERIAFTWDNTKKNFETGAFGGNQYTSMEGMDGLYWRTTEIGAQYVKRATGMDFKDLTQTKTEKGKASGAAMIPGATIEVTSPSYVGFDRKVVVKVTRRLNLPKFVDWLVKPNVTVVATAYVKDPVELIRTTDFIIHYANEVKEYLGK